MRWGIIGAGTIVTQFLQDTKQLADVQIVAIYSRTAAKSKQLATEYGIEKVCETIEELLGDPSVEHMYIGVPNHLHAQYVHACIAAKKNVLCEKPLAINRGQAERMIAAAAENGVLLMEGMWTRFFPLMKRLRAGLADGSFGTLRAASISLGYNALYAGEQSTWRFDLKSGFGALMDMGVYGVHFALDLCGAQAMPEIRSMAQVVGGLDYYNSFILRFGEQLISVTSSITNDTDLTATLYTDKGELTIGAPWWYPTEMTFKPFGGEAEKLEFPRAADGLQYEVQDFEQCVREGARDCPLSSHQNTLRAFDIMDELRRQWGVHYPQDGDPPAS